MKLKDVIAVIFLFAGLYAAIQFFVIFNKESVSDRFKDERFAYIMIGLALFSGLNFIAAAIIMSGRRDK